MEQVPLVAEEVVEFVDELEGLGVVEDDVASA